MTCTEFKERVTDLLDAALKPAADLQEHISACQTCATLYGELEKTLAALEPAERLEPSPLLKERTMSQIDRRPSALAPRRNLWLRVWKPALAAAAALLIVLLVLHTRHGKLPVVLADVVRNLSVFRPYSYTTECEVRGKNEGAPAYVFVMSPEVSRTECSDGRVFVHDVAKNEELWIWPELKKACKHLYPSLKGGIQPSIYDIVDQWTKRDARPEFLRTEWMEDKECSVFRSKDEHFECTLWVDNQAGVPVRVEKNRIQNGTKNGGTFIDSHFRFDIEIDPALYSLDPPADYTFGGVITHETADGKAKDDTEPFQPYSNLGEIEQDGKTKVFARHFILSRTVRRDEFPDGSIFIIDLGTGVHLHLWPQTKRAVKGTFPLYGGPLFHPTLSEIANDYIRLGWGPEIVGTRTIEGKTCTGFHYTDFIHVDITHWVDNKTNLPVRSEAVQWDNNRTVISSEFQLGIDTDPARFSLEPPPDYTFVGTENDK